MSVRSICCSQSGIFLSLGLWILVVVCDSWVKITLWLACLAVPLPRYLGGSLGPPYRAAFFAVFVEKRSCLTRLFGQPKARLWLNSTCLGLLPRTQQLADEVAALLFTLRPSSNNDEACSTGKRRFKRAGRNATTGWVARLQYFMHPGLMVLNGGPGRRMISRQGGVTISSTFFIFSADLSPTVDKIWLCSWSLNLLQQFDYFLLPTTPPGEWINHFKHCTSLLTDSLRGTRVALFGVVHLSFWKAQSPTKYLIAACASVSVARKLNIFCRDGKTNAIPNSTRKKLLQTRAFGYFSSMKLKVKIVKTEQNIFFVGTGLKINSKLSKMFVGSSILPFTWIKIIMPSGFCVST